MLFIATIACIAHPRLAVVGTFACSDNLAPALTRPRAPTPCAIQASTSRLSENVVRLEQAQLCICFVDMASCQTCRSSTTPSKAYQPLYDSVV
ncbi:hypothetical protein PR003_g13579 [Phytophthora rubi]|uniref:Secreted protein n=1 Tax=Phytophthora rubi TaxID=129364 RepID=A0A6A3NZZ9_9STRA|nr:hypothetical protein PR001_g1638 [Phytophthora rubi]KAE9334324.1 hypothetical protein PR003_g13579 [Phytophthora rubi]